MTSPPAGGPKKGALRSGFNLDLARCVGCGACVLACRIENQLPPGVSWRRIIQVNRPRVGGGPTYHFSLACHHCQNPPCVGACPTRALVKGPTGLVNLTTERCMGCRYCEMACPFGAPAYDEGRGVMTKCHLCSHRLEKGLDPACVVACPTGALTWFSCGDEGVGAEGLPAPEAPGFGDPAEAGPNLVLGEPGGQLRAEWFGRLRALLLSGGREVD